MTIQINSQTAQADDQHIASKVGLSKSTLAFSLAATVKRFPHDLILGTDFQRRRKLRRVIAGNIRVILAQVEPERNIEVVRSFGKLRTDERVLDQNAGIEKSSGNKRILSDIGGKFRRHDYVSNLRRHRANLESKCVIDFRLADW
jgi:hypothetical protein